MNFTPKTIFSIFFFFFLSLHIQAQKTVIDSLKNELSRYTQNDTTRVNLLNELAYSYYGTDLDKTNAYLEESEAIANAIDFKKGKARSLYINGVTQAVQSKFDKGLAFFNEALQVYETINLKKGVSQCYNGMGLLYYNKGNQEQAIAYYKKALKVDKAIGNKKEISNRLNNIGRAYDELSNYTEAVTYYKKSLEINKEINNGEGMADCFNNIGAVYSAQSNYPLALEYYNKSLSIEEKFEDTQAVSNTMNNLGVIYKNLQNYDKAISFYEKALKISDSDHGDEKYRANTLTNLGLAYKEKKNYTKALEFLTEGLKIFEEINNKGNKAICLNNIGDVYIALKDYNVAYTYFEQAKPINIEVQNLLGLCNTYLGMAKVNANKKQYNKALNNALKSKEISSKLELIKYQSEVQELLFIIYNNTGEYKRAIQSHQNFKTLNDSIFNKENIQKVSQLEYEYKYKRALDSASIRELKLTKTVKTTSQNLEKSQRNYLWAIIGVLIVSIVLGAIIFFQKYRNVKSKNENIVVEQRLLRSQMTPHFIFNSLSVLQGMILNKEESKSISYLSKFSKLLRTTLENSRHKLVALSDELSAVDSYMALQNLDVNPPFNYNLHVDSEIDTTAFKIPPMLIQPFIENAIEHAFVTEKENKEITIKIALKNKGLVCTIADNGIGVSMEKPKIKKSKKSLATTITAERLDMMSKEFKVEGSVNVINRESYGQKGTLVTLVIPYKIDSDS